VTRRQGVGHEDHDLGPRAARLDADLGADTRGHERYAIDGHRERCHRLLREHRAQHGETLGLRLTRCPREHRVRGLAALRLIAHEKHHLARLDLDHHRPHRRERVGIGSPTG